MRKVIQSSMICIALAMLLFRVIGGSDPHSDELARMDYEVFGRDTLSYWIDRFDFDIPLSVRDLPKNYRPAPRRITLGSGPKLEQEMIKVTSRVREFEDFYNYAHFKQREGLRFSPSGKPDQQMFAFDGRLNESRFEILADSLGTVYMASIVYEHGVRTVYMFDSGKLQMIVVRKNTPVRTGWDEVSHDIHLEQYFFGGGGLFAKLEIKDPIGPNSREREIVTSGLDHSLSDSLQRKAQIVYQLAKYISTYPGATCRSMSPRRLGSHDQLVSHFNEHMTSREWALAPRDSGMVIMDFEIDTSGSVRRILDQRLKKGSSVPPFNEVVISILNTTKWIPATAGCRPISDKLTLMAYYTRGRFTGISAM